MPQLVGACKDSKNISFMKKFLKSFGISKTSLIFAVPMRMW